MGQGKGQDIFIDAVIKIPESIRQKAEFLIAGAGTLPEEYIKKAESISEIKSVYIHPLLQGFNGSPKLEG